MYKGTFIMCVETYVEKCPNMNPVAILQRKLPNQHESYNLYIYK